MSVFSTLCYSMVPFSYRQAEADCTSAVNLDPKVRSFFLYFHILRFITGQCAMPIIIQYRRN
jgi:hypothetical protein